MARKQFVCCKNTMTASNRHNWLNETARDLNGKIYEHRKSQPSATHTAKWHKEYLESGAQYKMSWKDYCRGKTKAWCEQREIQNWTFGTGTFKGKKIGTIIKKNLDYIIFVLENQPKGKTARQITEFISRNPTILNSIKIKK